MSTTVIAVLVILLSHLLPLINITVDSKELEHWLQFGVDLISGIWIWYQNRKLHKAIESGTVAGSSKVTTLGLKA